METLSGYSYFSDDAENHRLFALAFIFSVICHFIFLLAVTLAPTHRSPAPLSPSVINVTMVTMPGPAVSEPPPAAPEEASEPAVVEAPPEAPAPEPEPEVAEAVAAPEAPKETVVLTPIEPEKKTLDPLDLKPAPEKKPEAPKEPAEKKPVPVKKALTVKKPKRAAADPVKDAIAKIRDKVKKEGPAATSAAAGKTGTGVAGNGAGTFGRPEMDIVDIYRVEIAYKVNGNWAFSDQLAGGGAHLQTIVVFKVMPNGDIRDVRFLEKSGNRYLDDSAYRAVVKSSPASPHPAGVLQPFIEVGLRFTPEGIQ